MGLEFWIIMGVLVAVGGSCSLKGTWWDRKKTRKKKRKNKNYALENKEVVLY